MGWCEIYQRLYKTTNYGKAEANQCPGVRYFPLYKDWLIPNVMDVGCGTGDTVELMRKHNISSDGMDWVNINKNMMVRDIRQEQSLAGYATATCIDVLEHVDSRYIHFVLENLRRCERAVVTVHCGPAKSHPPHDLHITQWPLDKWDREIKKTFRIAKGVVLEKNLRKLYWLE